MARKAFFAAFIIDEEAYTPEPGPVDRHFVVADLAQSSFGEQSGVSNFIVWESVEHMIADHRQRGSVTVDYLVGDESDERADLVHTPDACPSNHWNRGDDICGDCGTVSTCRRRRYHLPQSAHHFGITFRRRCVRRSPSNISR
ncbi:hypothetical protein ACVDG8_038120 (plasmid) [Mesorhizobium sp. ORM8.1]